jgi:hypothetical protein
MKVGPIPVVCQNTYEPIPAEEDDFIDRTLELWVIEQQYPNLGYVLDLE